MLKIQHGIVSANALLDVVNKHYPALKAYDCQLLALGCHDNYRIQSKRGSYVLRLYRYNWWPESDIDEELRFLEALIRRKLPVCKPILTKSRARYISLPCAEGLRYAAMFEFIPGRPFAHNFGARNVNMTKLGASLGLIHQVADSIKPVIQRWTMDCDAVFTPFFQQINDVLGHRQKDIAYLKKISQQFSDIIHQQSHHDLDFGLCHGDLHLFNVMLQQNGNVVLYDFDWCAHSWRLYDLATIRWSMPRNDKAKSPWNALLRGYANQRKLSSRDKKLLPWFVIFRYFEFLNFQLSIRHQFGHAWLNDNYYDHHIGNIKEWMKQHNNNP